MRIVSTEVPKAGLLLIILPFVASCNNDSNFWKWGRAPEVSNVHITPGQVYVDGPVRCSADVDDPDSADVTTTYTWRNATRNTSLGDGAALTLSPRDISPDESLECNVIAEDSSGNRGNGNASTRPACGFYDDASIADVNLELSLVFRPYVTDDLEPGYYGEPWDWDGDIPNWIMDVADALSDILDFVNSVYPDPNVATAAEVADLVNQILETMDEYGPGLFAATVPPDPDLFPYLIDNNSDIYTFFSGDTGLQWEDSYEASIRFEHMDLRGILGLAVDMEDMDVAFDDNMGDYLDQGGEPLILASSFIADGAYCSSPYYNPTDYPSSVRNKVFIPSSVLYLGMRVW